MSGHEIKIVLNTNETYDIEKVAAFTGYSSGHLRTLERENKIPESKRDSKGWRIWSGDDVLKIIKFKEQHQNPIASGGDNK